MPMMPHPDRERTAAPGITASRVNRVDSPAPLGIVNAAAPARICDNGGWTDTWFAGHGKVCNFGVSPRVQVRIQVHPAGALPARVMLDVENYGDRYAFDPGGLPGRHPLLEAVVDDIGLPDGLSVDIGVASEMPAGSSTGTSAATTVALIGALDRLASGGLSPHEVACAAHRIEVDRLGLQSGIQDQLCSAYGGINYIEMPRYPHASVTPIRLPDASWSELERRLVLVFLGAAHVSSEMHERVIEDLVEEGEGSAHLEALRAAAERSRDALRAFDLQRLGRAMTANTEVQARLHAGVVGTAARTAIEVAESHGAWGWKVNGAGGEGGSITVLCGPERRAKRQLLAAIREADSRFEVVPTRLARRGLRVWRT
jgi:D-glycero-alpha-D-manno-heptose-7-phosphate kinase